MAEGWGGVLLRTHSHDGLGSPAFTLVLGFCFCFLEAGAPAGRKSEPYVACRHTMPTKVVCIVPPIKYYSRVIVGT